MAVPFEKLGENCLWALQQFGEQTSIDLHKNLEGLYSKKQVQWELNRLSNQTLLGKKFIEKKKVSKLNSYKLKDDVKFCPVEVLTTMTNGVAFDY